MPKIDEITCKTMTIPNFRDLHSSADIVAPGYIFRCSTLSVVSELDVSFLDNINSILDLRGNDERALDSKKGDSLFWNVFSQKLEKVYSFVKRLTSSPAAAAAVAAAAETKTTSTARSVTSSDVGSITTDTSKPEKADIPSALAKAPPKSSKKWFVYPLLSEVAIGWTLLTRMSVETLKYFFQCIFTGRFSEIKPLFIREMDRGGLLLLNQIMVRRSGKTIKNIFELLADESSYPVLFFCTAGKDRTGLLACLILGCLGVSDELIVKDYLKSGEYYDMNPRNRQMLIDKLTESGLTPELWMSTPDGVMENTLKYIADTYGSIPQYLTSIGVAKETQDAVKKILLA